MTYDVRTVNFCEAPLQDVVRLMERHRIKRVPVVEGGKIVGIVTRANLLHAMASFGHEGFSVFRRGHVPYANDCLLS